MKILQLDIEGFRSLKKVSWKPGDLNVIIGPNGTGNPTCCAFLSSANSIAGAMEVTQAGTVGCGSF